MLAVADVVARLKELKINALHIKVRGRGGKKKKKNLKMKKSSKNKKIIIKNLKKNLLQDFLSFKYRFHLN
jgi:hypothetical protein